MSDVAASSSLSGRSSAAAPARADLGRLFRGSLSQGRLHPLYLPMQQYRSGQGPA